MSKRGEGWALAQAGQKWTGISRNTTKSGRTYAVESNLVPILNEVGELLEVVSLDVDISAIYADYENLASALSDSDHSLRQQRHFLTEYKRALKERFTNRSVDFEAKNGESLNFSATGIGVDSLRGDIELFILICQNVTESVRLSQDIVATQRELLYMLRACFVIELPAGGQSCWVATKLAGLLPCPVGPSQHQTKFLSVLNPPSTPRVAVPLLCTSAGSDWLFGG